jgi:hypothetical protein
MEKIGVIHKMEDNKEFKPYSSDRFGDHYRHPTFGTISIGRSHGGDIPLFGSSILHNETIRLKISRAELGRDLNRDWIHSKETLIEVEMSPTQFADAITSLNAGDGNPVTIRYIAKNEGENLTNVHPPYQNKVSQFNQEFKKDMAEYGKMFDETLKLAEQTHAQKRLIERIKTLKGHITNSIPLINESFSEQMEQTVKEAKGEVEAFVTHTVQAYGLDAIRKQAPQLPEANTIEGEVKELPEGK